MPCIYVNFKNPTGPQSVQIGPTGTTDIDSVPFDVIGNAYSQAGMIYLSSQLSAIANKQITAIEFQYDGFLPGYSINNQTIKMGHSQTTTNYFNSNEPVDYSETLIGNLVTVKNSFTFSNIDGGLSWIKHDFDNYFTYNGTDNLLISWENRDGRDSRERDLAAGSVKGNISPGLTTAIWLSISIYPNFDSQITENKQPNLIIHYQ